MSWAAVFWIVYGIGSTLFVVYLFRMGKNVASNRKELIEREIESIRPRSATSGIRADRMLSQDDGIAVSDAHPAKLGSRLHVERIFQPDENHVAVQGVRGGASCVINLPLGDAIAMALIPETKRHHRKAL